jgi:hypothetical protein
MRRLPALQQLEQQVFFNLKAFDALSKPGYLLPRTSDFVAVLTEEWVYGTYRF